MIHIKIFDCEFAHTVSCTGNPILNFKWDRDIEKYSRCWFTDKCLSKVDTVNNCVKIAWLIEPKAINANTYNFVRFNHNKFDFIITFDRSLISIDPTKFLYYPYGGTWISKHQLYSKSKIASIIASDKKKTKGHILRHSIIRDIPNISVFGNGYNRISNKIEGLQEYMFSFAIENSIQDDYFSEKLIDCFVTGTVPVFFGTNNVNKYFNANGIIHINSVKDAKKLNLSSKLYESKLDSIKDNFEIAKQYMSPEDWLFTNYPHLFK